MLKILENFDADKLPKSFCVKKYDNPFYQILVLKKSDEIIGYLSYFVIYERLEIEYIYILEQHRRSGYANTLLKKLIEIAISNKCINITLEVDVNNIGAINLYKKNGFEIVSIREKYYGENDGYLMIKEIEV